MNCKYFAQFGSVFYILDNGVRHFQDGKGGKNMIWRWVGWKAAGGDKIWEEATRVKKAEELAMKGREVRVNEEGCRKINEEGGK